jgi:hypothetical protein
MHDAFMDVLKSAEQEKICQYNTCVCCLVYGRLLPDGFSHLKPAES